MQVLEYQNINTNILKIVLREKSPYTIKWELPIKHRNDSTYGMQSMWHGIGYVGDAITGLANFTVHL